MELKVNGKLILSSWCCFKQEACWVPSGSNIPSPLCPQGLNLLKWRLLRCQGLFQDWGTPPRQLQAPNTSTPWRAVPRTTDSYKVCLSSQELMSEDDKWPSIWPATVGQGTPNLQLLSFANDPISHWIKQWVWWCYSYSLVDTPWPDLYCPK